MRLGQAHAAAACAYTQGGSALLAKRSGLPVAGLGPRSFGSASMASAVSSVTERVLLVCGTQGGGARGRIDACRHAGTIAREDAPIRSASSCTAAYRHQTHPRHRLPPHFSIGVGATLHVGPVEAQSHKHVESGVGALAQVPRKACRGWARGRGRASDPAGAAHSAFICITPSASQPPPSRAVPLKLCAAAMAAELPSPSATPPPALLPAAAAAASPSPPNSSASQGAEMGRE